VPLTRSASRLFGALFASLLLVPAGAHAAQVNGDPLTVASGDESGQLGVTFTGSGLTEFFGSCVNPQTGEVTPAYNTGFVVVAVEQRDGPGPVSRYGSRWSNVTPIGAPAVTGDGSAGNPYRIEQHFRASDGRLDMRQVITYTNGDTHFRAFYQVTNTSQIQLTIRIAMGSDLAGGGSDRGTGLFDGGPPRFVGGFNPTVGAVAGLSEVTPWSHFEEGYYGDVLARADASPTDPPPNHLLDTIDPKEVDNGVAAQWDVGNLGPGQSTAVEVDWRFARTYNLTPETQAAATGEPAAFTVRTTDLSGRPQSQRVRWTVSGVNSAGGNVRTGDNGTATFEYIGANPGSDRIEAYVDQNDNGQRDEGEALRAATVEWTGPDAPQFGTEVNVRPVRGRVLVRLPRNANVKGKWAEAAQSRFVRLTGHMQLPVGTELDTKRGAVSLTSSKGPTGGVQSSQFFSGRFVVRQSRRQRGLTEIRMSEPMKCTRSSRRGKVVASAVRTRKLWGRGKGRFRTRGRRSAATVRGTTWLQKDTCKTTTTVVREGVVIVRDFAKRKNIRVKAPRRYVARQARKKR
jgi:hypothetical protein